MTVFVSGGKLAVSVRVARLQPERFLLFEMLGWLRQSMRVRNEGNRTQTKL